MNRLKQLVKRLLPAKARRSVAGIYHRVTAILASYRYGRPARNMRVIGVTGTNGKTSTSYMVHRMMVEAGLNTGLMTTVAYGVNNDITPQIEHMTTVSAPLLNKRLAAMKAGGADWLVLETTSHALDQHRTWGVPFEIAISTNVTHEHLDYHGTFEHYRASKHRLFELASNHGIVNADDPESRDFANNLPTKTSYGIEAGDLRASDIVLAADGSTYTASIGDDVYTINCHIPGEFNVYNSLAAVAAGRAVGLSREQIERGIAAMTDIEGRMTTVDEGQKYSVVIDFAHTPDAFERLLSDLRRSTKGKLVALFGSAGQRDEAKRWTQGEIAGKYCDEVIVTEEDDRDVDGNLIMSQIAEGAERSGKVKDRDLFCILDRPSAIQFAMTRVSEPGDTVVLLGKGHEKTIERADGEHPWDELAKAKKAIKQTLKPETSQNLNS